MNDGALEWLTILFYLVVGAIALFVVSVWVIPFIAESLGPLATAGPR